MDVLVLLKLLIGYTVYHVWCVLKEGNRGGATTEKPGTIAPNVIFILVGLGVLVLGARWMLSGSVSIARGLGINELIIGLTVVAAGTSLPEVATSLLATWRGQREIAIGNVVGSNIFNILGVLGFAVLLVPGGVPVPSSAFNFDFPVMVAVAGACLPIFLTGHTIARWEGGLFLFYYVAYTLFLILEAAKHDALPGFRAAMWFVVVPLTIITLAVGAAHHHRARKEAL